MEIKTKYSIKDTVWVCIESEPRIETAPCPSCKGQGSILVDGNEYICKKCHGSGIVYKNLNNSFIPHKTSIFDIDIRVDINGKIDIIYEVDPTATSSYMEDKLACTDFPENKVFSTKEDCLKMCEKLNNTETSDKI